MLRSRLTYVYVLVCCCLMSAASMGLCFYTSGLFYEAVAEDLGATVGAVSRTTFIVLGAMAACSLFISWLLKRVPFKILIAAGLVLEAGSTLMMAFAFAPGWLYFFGCLQGVGAGLCGMVMIAALLNSWFHDENGWILSFVFAFGALWAALMSPAFGFFITNFGWRLSYVIKGTIIALLLLGPVFIPIDATPARMGLPAAREKKLQEAKVDGSRIPMVFGQILLLSVLAALLVGIPHHLADYTVSVGLTLENGASLFTWAMVGNILFKLAAGLLTKKLEPTLTLIGLCIVSAVGLFGMLLSVSAANLVVLKSLAFLAGSIYGLSELCAPMLIGHYFGKNRYVRLYSLVNALQLIFMAVAIGCVGYLYDMAHNYIWILIFALLIDGAIGVLLYLLYNGNQVPDSWKQSANRIKEAMDENKSKTKELPYKEVKKLEN